MKIKKEWSKKEKMLIKWFDKRFFEDRLPVEPFDLCQGRTVIGPQNFFDMLKKDIEAGPGSPRAQYGALCEDLKLLFFCLERDFRK
jgi:hypothetical protein